MERLRHGLLCFEVTRLNPSNHVASRVRNLDRESHPKACVGWWLKRCKRVYAATQRIYGILISMFWDEGQHGRPHFHARYGEFRASLDLAGEIIVGELPRQQLRLVQAWSCIPTS